MESAPEAMDEIIDMKIIMIGLGINKISGSNLAKFEE
jgi:hypothetical protein